MTPERLEFCEKTFNDLLKASEYQRTLKIVHLTQRFRDANDFDLWLLEKYGNTLPDSDVDRIFHEFRAVARVRMMRLLDTSDLHRAKCIAQQMR